MAAPPIGYVGAVGFIGPTEIPPLTPPPPPHPLSHLGYNCYGHPAGHMGFSGPVGVAGFIGFTGTIPKGIVGVVGRRNAKRHSLWAVVGVTLVSVALIFSR